MNKVNTLTVFMGSKFGNQPEFGKVAQTLGEYLANNHITLVYGGSRDGLMGQTATTSFANGGTVIGINPKNLAEEAIGPHQITELIEVDNMSIRKDMLINKSDALIALPGGFGTLEEVGQTISWAKIHLHQKPLALLNINGFYDHLWQWLETSVAMGFVDAKDLKYVQKVDTIEAAFDYFEDYFATKDEIITKN